MKLNFINYVIIVLFNYFIISAFAENDYYIVSIRKDDTDIKYDISSKEIQESIDNFVNDVLNVIYNIAKKNKNTYLLENGELDEKIKEFDLVEIEKRNEPITEKNRNIKFLSNRERMKRKMNKRSDNPNEEDNLFDSEIVIPLCPVSNYYAAGVYLSDKIIDKVKNVPGVINVEKSAKSSPDHYFGKYYDVEAIQKETNWTSVVVQDLEEIPTSIYYTHLSLISQGHYEKEEPGVFDRNFYYPATAGQGVHIYFMDDGYTKGDLDDFDTYEGTPEERTISCDAKFADGKTYPVEDDERENCHFPTDPEDHGNMVMSVAGGKHFGVAKKANLHMLLKNNTSYIEDLNAFDYILSHGEPHKTIISISLGGYGYNKVVEDKVRDVTDAGYIIVVAAGNDNFYCCHPKEEEKLFYHYSGFENVITVGAAACMGLDYTRTPFSNYGECVDIHAPESAMYASMQSDLRFQFSIGTSVSAPIVAGVAATILSEYSEIEFDYKLMKEYLIDMSLKDVLKNMKPDTPNRFLNNGKKIVYYKCNHRFIFAEGNNGIINIKYKDTPTETDLTLNDDVKSEQDCILSDMYLLDESQIKGMMYCGKIYETNDVDENDEEATEGLNADGVLEFDSYSMELENVYQIDLVRVEEEVSLNRDDIEFRKFKTREFYKDNSKTVIIGNELTWENGDDTSVLYLQFTSDLETVYAYKHQATLIHTFSDISENCIELDRLSNIEKALNLKNGILPSTTTFSFDFTIAERPTTSYLEENNDAYIETPTGSVVDENNNNENPSEERITSGPYEY